MIRRSTLASILLVLVLGRAAHAAEETECAFTLKNAHVWTGEGFERRDLSWAGGAVSATPKPTSTSADASWLWITPPLADAHTHNVNQAVSLADAAHQSLMRRGIFYALNPNNILTPQPAVVGPWIVDAVYAGGGVTGPGGHPKDIYALLVQSRQLGPLTMKDLEGRAFHEAADPESARLAVRRVKQTGAPVVKLFLSGHNTKHSKGLSEDSFRAAVAEAKRLGLRSIVHVDTAADYRLAVETGVFAIVHMPGALIVDDAPDADYLLTERDARATKQAGILVTPTVSLAFFHGPRRLLKRAQALQAKNLEVLSKAGVAMALGADVQGRSVIDEMNQLRLLSRFDDAPLLRMATENGARLIHPDRKVGRLEAGWEASFVGYYADPSEDWNVIGQPFLGVRAGKALFDGARMLPKECQQGPSE